jgi:hypothetical protein
LQDLIKKHSGMNPKLSTKPEVVRCSTKKSKQPMLNELLSLKSLTEVGPAVPDTCGPTSCGRNSTTKWQSPAAPSKIDRKKLYKIPLVPINCSFGVVTEKQDAEIPLRRMVRKYRKAKNAEVTVMFAIRRPGCGNCKLHGQQLSEMLKEQKGAVNGVGVIKHINVDNDALLDFYKNYFTCPIYKDEKWELYHSLGNRKIKIWTVLKNIVRMEKLYAKKGVKNTPLGGEGQTQGGVLVFDKSGSLRYVQYENYSELLDMETLNAAIEEAKVPLHDEGTSGYLTNDIDLSNNDSNPSQDLTLKPKSFVKELSIDFSAHFDGDSRSKLSHESVSKVNANCVESLTTNQEEESDVDVWDQLVHQKYLKDRITAAREKRTVTKTREKVGVRSA